MNIDAYSTNMIEIPSGILYKDSERLEELNNRIHRRIIPDNDVKLPHILDIRSTPTRNCLTFPIITSNNTTYKHELSKYNIEDNFAPIQRSGPFINFVNNVDRESTLRNQIYAIQNGAEQAVFIPSSNSDLYNVRMPLSSNNIEQPFAGLFHQHEKFVTTENSFVKNNNIGGDFFNNHTTTQLRTEYR